MDIAEIKRQIKIISEYDYINCPTVDKQDKPVNCEDCILHDSLTDTFYCNNEHTGRDRILKLKSEVNNA